MSRIASVFLLLLAVAACRASPETDRAPEGNRDTRDAKPALALLTSLPIAFGEQFSLDTPRSPLLEAIERDHAVRPVDGPEQLPPRGMLLAIQPQALTAERLVALDRWVREGGRVLLFADPQLAAESGRPLGDPFRPPYAFPDTGLLQHWGLRLRAGERGEESSVRVGGEAVPGASVGRLETVGKACALSSDGAVADCRIGLGRAMVVADADLLLAESRGPDLLRRLLGDLAR